MDRQTLQSAALIVGGMAIIGLIDNYVRLAAESAGLWQFHLIRAVVGLATLGLMGWAFSVSFRARRWWAVGLRSGFQVAAMMLYFAALPVLPIAQVGAGLFTAPIFVLLFSALIFRRRVGPRRMLAVATGFAGVIVLLRPEMSNLSGWSFVPLIAGALYAMSALTTRIFCADEPLGAMMAGMFAVYGLVSALAAVGLALAPQGGTGFVTRDWVMAPGTVFYVIVFVQALGSLLAIGMVTKGYQSGETSFLTVFEYSFLIFAGLWGWVIWGDALGPRDALGIAMIIGAGAVIALSRERSAGAAA